MISEICLFIMLALVLASFILVFCHQGSIKLKGAQFIVEACSLVITIIGVAFA